MESSLQAFSGHFLELMKTSYECSKHGFSSLNISTMTIVCQTNRSNIDMEKVVSHFDTCNDLGATLKKRQRHDEPEVTKRGKVKKNFFNQATMTFKDITTKSIKIFTNGKLQMTGITSLLEGFRVAHRICDLVSRCTETTIHPVSVNIAMINSDFCIRRRINLIELMSHIKEHTCTYDPDTYPGLKLKFNKVSVFIFSTGSIVITGSNNISHLHDAFRFVTDLIVEHADTCTWGITKEKKRKMIYEHGYPKNIIDCCASKFSM